jgi:hypothetical protein
MTHMTRMSAPRAPRLLPSGSPLALWAVCALSGSLGGCLSALPDPAEGGAGPTVTYSPLSRPSPVAASPNDAATRLDPSSPTGRRLNVSLSDNTAHGAAVRAALNDLDGFAPSAPLTIPFDGPVDLSTLGDDGVVLVNIDPKSPRYGERVPLDLPIEPEGSSPLYPLTSTLGWLYGLPPDPLPPSLFFPADNLVDLDGDGVEVFSTRYEVSTHTLIVRPLKPLDHGARHAALLRAQVEGWGDAGELGPVRSPFPQVAALSQLEDVRHAARLAGVPMGEVAFGWSFTTGDPTTPLRDLRRGLYGEGPLRALHAVAPATLSEVRSTDIEVDDPTNPHDTPFILKASHLEKLTRLIASVLNSDGYNITFDDVDYFVFGAFPSPQLRGDLEGGERVAWGVGPEGLRVTPRLAQVPFFLSVPKRSVSSAPPFPVVIYFHGTNTSRMEALIAAQELARQGLALIAFDQVGHGPIIPNVERLRDLAPDLGPILDRLPTLLAQVLAPQLLDDLAGLTFEEGLRVMERSGVYRELAVIGRWEDVDRDGFHDAAEGFFDSDPLALCGAFWQDTLDAMQLVRVLRALSPSRVPAYLNDPHSATEARLSAHLLSGDFNADGVLDIGGPRAQLSAAGTSLGGIHALLLAAAEPEVRVVTPIVPGGGMVDILLRTSLRFVAKPLFEDFFGQLVVGCPRPTAEGEAPAGLWVSLNDDAERCEGDLEGSAHLTLEGDWRGARLTLTNDRSGERATGAVDARGSFALQVSSDPGDPLTLTLTREGAAPVALSLVAVARGSGYAPHTPDFRRAATTLQHILDRCDPITFAHRLTHPRPEDGPPAKVLMFSALGDRAVPVSAAVHLANALGLLGEEERVWRPRLEALRARGVIAGEPWGPDLESPPLYDVEDILNDNPTSAAPMGPFTPLEVGDGLSAVRLNDVEGKHEWIAGYERDGFSYSRRTLRQLAAFHRCGGRLVLDEDPECLQSEECALFNTLYLRRECALSEAP